MWSNGTTRDFNIHLGSFPSLSTFAFVTPCPPWHRVQSIFVGEKRTGHRSAILQYVLRIKSTIFAYVQKTVVPRAISPHQPEPLPDFDHQNDK
jgi:hypothetical protein